MVRYNIFYERGINLIDKIIYKNIDGIKLCFIEKKDYVEKQAMIAFNYGSAENIFIKDNEEISLPPGIAHFLEHKMFEDEEYNVFEVFNKYGGNVNAFTNFSTTAYYFTCVENFNENFKELLKFVSRPYFTEENVEKEKGIIEQEIKMYDDSPYWKVYFNLIGIMYDKDDPITKDIAGGVSDIKKIDKDMLYTCYNNFYTKDNAIIIVCGDIDDLEKIEDNILQNLKINEKKSAIIKQFNKISQNSVENVEKDMKIKQKIFNIGFKDVVKCGKIEKQIISNKILLDIIFGTSSKFYEEMYNNGIIDNSFGFDYNCVQANKFYTFSGVSNKPKDLQEYIKKEIKKFKQNGIREEDFNRIKNKQIGEFIKQFNFINSIVSMEADFFSHGFNIPEYFENIKNVKFEDVKKGLEQFNEDAYLSVIT